MLSLRCEAPPGGGGGGPAGGLESSQLRPHGSAWLEPSWCHASQAPLCVSARVRACVAISAKCRAARACVCAAPVCSLQPVDLSHFARAGGTGGCQAAPGVWVQYS